MVPWARCASASIDDVFIVNPTYAERAKSILNIMVVGTKDGIVMVESGSKECSEEQVVDAIEFAHVEIKKICAGIEDLVSRAGKTKRVPAAVDLDQAYLDELTAKCGDELKDALDTQKHPKFESYDLVKQIKDKLKKELPEGDPAAAKKLSAYYELLREKIFRDQVLNDRVRPDHRAFDQIRAVTSRLACCLACMARLCSPAAKPRRWSPQPSVPPTTHSGWKATKASRSAVSCCITTSRRFRSVKSAAWVA